MTISEEDAARVAQLLCDDVAATIGPEHETEIRRLATESRQFYDAYDDYLDKVVEEVQQYIHDCFIDTTWPTCPIHGRHPLWLSNRNWMCAQDRVVIARIGALTGPRRR